MNINSPFNEPKRRSAEFIQPSLSLKFKIGSGGLDHKIIQQAEKIIEKNNIDFIPMGNRFLTALREAHKIADKNRTRYDTDSLIAVLVNPAMQLKANGKMFGYSVVTDISALLIRFLESVDDINDDVLDLVDGFIAAINAILIGHLSDQSSKDNHTNANDLYLALDKACTRYFTKYITTDDDDTND